MDTKPEIPDFKLAKVGTDRRRKGAGFAWFGNGGSGGAALAKGGAGVAGLLGKMAIVAVVGVMGLGAFSVGRGLAPNSVKNKKKPKAFAGVQKYTEDVSNLPKDSKYSGRSGLGMVAGRMDGKTEAELAAERAEAERLAREAAEAEAQAAAEAEAAEAEAAAAAAAGDPAAAAAAAAGGALGAGPGGMSRKYGELSKSFGGGRSGLAGGAGVSGNFSGKKFAAKDGKALAFAKRTAPSRTRSNPMRVNSRARGLVRKQLDKAFQFSQAAKKAEKEGSSELAAQAFDGNAGAGTAIGGAGAGTGGGTQGTPNGDGTTSSGDGGNYGLGENDFFGPCRDGQTTAENPNCLTDDQVTGEDDPTNGIVKTLKVLMGIYCLLSVLKFIYMLTPWTWGISQYFKFMQILLAAAIGILGVVLMGMGRPELGLMFTIGGTMLGLLAAAEGDYGASAGSSQMWMIGIQALISGGGGLFSAPERKWNAEKNKWEGF